MNKLILIISLVFFSNSLLASQEISERYEIVGVIGSDVVMLRDKQTNTQIFKKNGENLGTNSKIVAISDDKITVEVGGKNFFLVKDRFGGTASSVEERRDFGDGDDFGLDRDPVVADGRMLPPPSRFDSDDEVPPPPAYPRNNRAAPAGPLDRRPPPSRKDVYENPEKRQLMNRLDDYYQSPESVSDDELLEIERQLFE